MTTKNEYEVLGVAETASAADIKSAQKKLSLETHPDRNPGVQEKEAQFRAVQAAYETLSDPAKRSAYDAKLRKERLLLILALLKAAEKVRLERESAARVQAAQEAAAAQARAEWEAAARAQAAQETAAAQARAEWEAMLRKVAQAPPIWPPPPPVSVQFPPSTLAASSSLSTEQKVAAGGLVVGFGLLLAAMFSGSKGGAHWDPSTQRNRDNATGRFRSF